MKKVMSLLLAIFMLLSASTIAFAVGMTCPICAGTDFGHCNLCGYSMKCQTCGHCSLEGCNTIEHSAGTMVEYDANDKDGDGELDNLEYFVTVPALLVPGESGLVTIEGCWPSYASIIVTADESVQMLNDITSGNEKNLEIFFEEISLMGNNETPITKEIEGATALVEVEPITDALFGVWTGHFNYYVDYAEADFAFFIKHDYADSVYYGVEGMTWKDWVSSRFNHTIGTNHELMYEFDDVYEYISCQGDHLRWNAPPNEVNYVDPNTEIDPNGTQYKLSHK